MQKTLTKLKTTAFNMYVLCRTLRQKKRKGIQSQRKERTCLSRYSTSQHLQEASSNRVADFGKSDK